MNFSPRSGWAGTNNLNGTKVRISDSSLDPDLSNNEVYFSPNQNAPIASISPKGSQYLLNLAFGGPGTEHGEFNFPSHIAIDSADQTYVVCDTPLVTVPHHGHIDVFDNKGNYAKTIGEYTLYHAYAVAFDSKDNIFVTETTPTNQGRVATFSSSGAFNSQLGVGVLSSLPRGLAVDDQGNVYVTDPSVPSVFKLNADGIGTEQLALSGAWTFQNPQDVAFDKLSHTLYIADSIASAIYIFQNDVHIATWDYRQHSLGSKDLGNVDAKGNGLPSAPANITIDSVGNLIVHFRNLGIFKLDATGKRINASIPSQITPLGELTNPLSLAVDSSDQLYVLDGGWFKCVKVYSASDSIELVVHVPSGAKTGSITVNVRGAAITTKDDVFQVFEIPPKTDDLYLPEVSDIELTQGLATYPFIIEKDTLLWASIKGYFGDPNRDSVILQINQPSGLVVKADPAEFDVGPVTTVKVHLPHSAMDYDGQYTFDVKFTRDNQPLKKKGSWSKQVTAHDAKTLNVLFLKFTDLAPNLWGQQNPFSYFKLLPFFSGIETVRRTYPLYNFNYMFDQGMYSPNLMGGVQESKRSLLTVEARMIFNIYLKYHPPTTAAERIQCVVGLIDSKLNQTQALGWALGNEKSGGGSIITFFNSYGPPYNWGATLAHEIAHTYDLVPPSQANYAPGADTFNEIGHSINKMLDNEEGSPIRAWHSITDVVLEGDKAGSIMSLKTVTDNENCFFESRTATGKDLDYQWLFQHFNNPPMLTGGCCFFAYPGPKQYPDQVSEPEKGERIVMVGTINDKKKASIAQSFLTKEDFPMTPDVDSEYELVFTNSSGTILARHGFQSMSIQDPKASSLSSSIFSLVKLFPAGTKTVEIRFQSAPVASLVYTNTPPEVTSVSVELREPLPPIITWQSTNQEPSPLQYTVLYSTDDGRTFRPIGTGIYEKQFIWDHSMLPASDHALIKVIGSNGLRESSALSAPFQLAPKPPQAAILAPVDGTVFTEDDPIILHGAAYDPKDGNLEAKNLKWWLDGTEVGTGRILRIRGISQKTPEGTILTPINEGSHTVTLTAINSDNTAGGAQIRIKVLQRTKETNNYCNTTRLKST